MIKRILLTIVMLLLIAYLVAAVTVFNSKPAHQVCRDMELVIKDTLPSCKRKAFIPLERKWTAFTPKRWKKS